MIRPVNTAFGDVTLGLGHNQKNIQYPQAGFNLRP